MNAPATAAPAAPTKAPPEQVTMNDGSNPPRVVEFSGKKRLDKNTFVDSTSVTVRLDWRNGTVQTLSVAHGMSPEFLATPVGKLAAKALGHGLEQKLGDESSGVEDIEDAIETTAQLIDRLKRDAYEGWRKVTEAGAGAGASILVKAVMAATGQPVEVVRPHLGAMSAKERAALRLDASVAPHIKRLEDEKAAKLAAAGKGKPAVDTKSLLANIGKAPVTSAFAAGDAAAAAESKNSGAAEDPIAPAKAAKAK